MKIKPGMLCTFDTGNSLDQNDSGISHVIVLKLKRHRFLRPSLWIVQNADDPKSEKFTCPENALSPSNVCAIRFPSSVPNFNELDSDAIEYAIKYIESQLDAFTKFKSSEEIKMHTKLLNRLKATYEKIKFYNEMRDV